jgi:hypothetical protein
MTLIFVYNAASGTMNAVMDSLHKWISPETYSCKLCQLAFGTFGAKAEWTEYLATIPYPMEFLHADELKKNYGILDIGLPAVYIKQDNSLPELWIDSKAINACTTLAELQTLITSQLKQIAPE